MTTYLNRDDIIRMAQDSGLKFREHLDEFFSPLCDGVYFEDLEDFAALVLAAEREACAKVCDQRAEEDTFEGGYANACAEAIRARGQ
jgi:hypothetical protein